MKEWSPSSSRATRVAQFALPVVVVLVLQQVNPISIVAGWGIPMDPWGKLVAVGIWIVALVVAVVLASLPEMREKATRRREASKGTVCSQCWGGFETGDRYIQLKDGTRVCAGHAKLLGFAESVPVKEFQELQDSRNPSN